MDEHAAKIQTLVEPLLADHQMELVELTCRPAGRQVVVRFLVDRVGGVTIQQCAQANQRLGAALEASNLIEGSFTVEVSSPGLDRPLVSKRDFERALGEELHVVIGLPDGRTKDWDGMLLAVQPEAIVLKTISGNETLPMGTIRTAKKVVHW